ncbi:MAG: Gfo/Idh/MocA family oxidoreductase [Alphaproteobacteria bacterium]|nr:Gfo/Idh/MocA family oxidoreductase [Alphaproteobacteria bacterium]
MATQTLGIILHGATGRICSTQHLHNALAPIIAEGGLPVGDDTVMPRLLLVGRNEERLAEIARANNVADWTTDLDAALADPDYPVFFEAAATHQRLATLGKALAAGKHIYSEKPVAPTVAEGLALLRDVEASGLKHGAVEDKIYLPGFQKLSHLIESGFIGRIVSFRIEFGWWVFDGKTVESQRPSWNYKRSGGGGLLSDMHPHWRYVIENIVGPIRQVVSTASTAQPERVDEDGKTYRVDVEDSATTLLELEDGAYGTILSSWATRIRHDDLMTLRVDGIAGSAVAGLRRCWAQSAADTPVVTGSNLGKEANTSNDGAALLDDWQEVSEAVAYKNPYRYGWEGFIRHVVADEPFASDLRAGIRDVQLAEACRQSAADKAWVSLDRLT